VPDACLPSGTVTFLFTDIEESTRAWERDASGMREALARHDALLRQAIEARGGHVFKTVGDAFCAAFPSAPAALAERSGAPAADCGFRFRSPRAGRTGHLLTACRAALGDDFETDWNSGRALPPEQALAEAFGPATTATEGSPKG
jgi:class 3 adenylate cyclase